jgi:hypothetical protein
MPRFFLGVPGHVIADIQFPSYSTNSSNRAVPVRAKMARQLVLIVCVGERAARIAPRYVRTLVRSTFYIDGDRIASGKCLIESLVKELFHMRLCGWRGAMQVYFNGYNEG